MGLNFIKIGGNFNQSEIRYQIKSIQSGGYTSDLMKQFHDYKRQIYQDKQYEDEAAVHRMITYKLPSILFYIVIIRKLTLSRILKRLMQNLGIFKKKYGIT